MIRQARLNYESQLIADIKTKPRHFYRSKKVKDHIEYLMKADGTKTSSHAEAAEVLAEFFGSVYVREDTMNIPEFPTRCRVQIDSLSVTEEDLFQKLSTLNTGKAMGPDKIHTWILKEGQRGLMQYYSIFC